MDVATGQSIQIFRKKYKKEHKVRSVLKTAYGMLWEFFTSIWFQIECKIVTVFFVGKIRKFNKYEGGWPAPISSVPNRAKVRLVWCWGHVWGKENKIFLSEENSLIKKCCTENLRVTVVLPLPLSTNQSPSKILFSAFQLGYQVLSDGCFQGRAVYQNQKETTIPGEASK